jgi:hypothetical protein
MRSHLLLPALLSASFGFAPAPFPKPAPKPAPVPAVEGTSWSGTSSDGDRYTFRFEKGGILGYTSPTGTYRNGTWRQTGAGLYMETNMRYWEFHGTIKGDRLPRRATNVRAGQWTYDLKRDTPGSQPGPGK